MSGLATRLELALGDLLRALPELEAAAIVTIDGLPMASALPPGMHEDRVAAMSAALLSLGERAAEGLGRGALSQVYIEGENGTVYLLAAGEDAVLVAVASRGAKAGLVLYELRHTAAQLDHELDKAGPQFVAAPAPQLVPPPATQPPTIQPPAAQPPTAQPPTVPSQATSAPAVMPPVSPPPATPSTTRCDATVVPSGAHAGAQGSLPGQRDSRGTLPGVGSALPGLPARDGAGSDGPANSGAANGGAAAGRADDGDAAPLPWANFSSSQVWT